MSSRLLSTISAFRALKLELKNLQEEPVEGFRVKLIDHRNMFEWEVAIFGTPNTIYQGGYFRAHMAFPLDYPYSPPTIRFINKFWHPNVYMNGSICISILHAPTKDPTSDELASERWNPAQSVRTILLSIISLLNEPNTSSPANIEASLMYKRWVDGKDEDYVKIVREQVEASKADAAKAGVVVPLTVEDYCKETKIQTKKSDDDIVDSLDFFDDINEDDVYDNDEDDEDDGDSGRSES